MAPFARKGRDIDELNMMLSKLKPNLLDMKYSVDTVTSISSLYFSLGSGESLSRHFPTDIGACALYRLLELYGSSTHKST